jgi:hypothetical protein
MRGLSLLIYVIFFTILAIVENSVFFQIAGSLNGASIQVEVVVSDIYGAIMSRGTFSPPMGTELYFNNCSFPFHESLEEKDVENILETCTRGNSVMCAFYKYYSTRFRACKAMIYYVDKVYYFSDTSTPVLEANVEDGVLKLIQVTN